jgi:AbrB family looped-hinge helix DNA binding protein
MERTLFIATLNAKGQITIPARVRRELDLSTGDQILFLKNEEGCYTIKLVKCAKNRSKAAEST